MLSYMPTLTAQLDPHGTVVAPPNPLPYLVAVAGMVIAGVFGVVVIAIARPMQDIVLLVGAVFGVLTPTTLSLLALMKAQETHLSVNSRLDAFMANARSAAYEQGLRIGNEQGNTVADARTDALMQARAVARAKVDAQQEQD